MRPPAIGTCPKTGGDGIDRQADGSDTGALLQQLAQALAVHRLYDGDTDAPAFHEAAARVARCARAALSAGPVAVQLSAGRFVVDGEPLAGHRLDRLAQACFEHRIEHLELHDPPPPDQLAAFLAAVADDVTVDVASALARAGVTALRVSDHAPDAAHGRDLAEHLLALSTWTETVGDPPATHTPTPRIEPSADAATLYERLSAAAAALPDDATVRSSFARDAYELLTDLSVDQRPVFGRLVLDAVPTDPFADRFLGHLTDTRLAELIVRVAEHEGTHPATLARQVAADGGRHAALPSLVHELITSAPPPARGDGVDAPPLADAVPATPGHARQLGVLALRDYLGNQPHPAQLDAVIGTVVARLRDDLQAGDHVMVAAALDTLSEAATFDEAIAEPLQRPLDETLDPVLVGRLAASATAAGRPLHPGLFRPFGTHALDPLLSALPGLPAAPRRRVVDVLVGIVPDHLDALMHLLPTLPTPVVAELATIVGGIGGARMLPLLTRLADHRSPEVLDRVVDALAAQDVSSSAPTIARIAQRSDDRSRQRRCVELLIAQGTPASRELLGSLSQRPELARRDRRRAASAARRHRG